jgi:uncharacterized protein YjcR
VVKKNKFKDELEKKNFKTGRNRKVSYKKEVLPFLEDIKNLILNGYNNKEIANIIGCNIGTLYVWRKEHKEFDDLFNCDEFKAHLRDELIDSLYQRAKGFYVEENTIQFVKGKEVYKEVSSKYKYSDKAAEIVLRNVLGDKTGNNEINITFNDGTKTMDIKFGTVDDEGDFDDSR